MATAITRWPGRWRRKPSWRLAIPPSFPEQIREGLRPWSPLKVYARVPFFDVTPKGMYDYAIDKYVPVRFFDYVTQKPGRTRGLPPRSRSRRAASRRPPGSLTCRSPAKDWAFRRARTAASPFRSPRRWPAAYHRYGSRVPAAEHEESFFDGIDVSVGGIALAGRERAAIPEGAGWRRLRGWPPGVTRQYHADRPQSIAPVLADGLRATRALIGQVRAESLPEPGKAMFCSSWA